MSGTILTGKFRRGGVHLTSNSKTILTRMARLEGGEVGCSRLDVIHDVSPDDWFAKEGCRVKL